MNTARLLGALGMIPPGVATGVFVNLLVDRVPLRRQLRPLDAWPRRCPSVALAPLPPHPGDVVDAAAEVDDMRIAEGDGGGAEAGEGPTPDLAPADTAAGGPQLGHADPAPKGQAPVATDVAVPDLLDLDAAGHPMDEEPTDSEAAEADEPEPDPGPVLIPYEEGAGHGTPVETRPFRRRRCPACGAKAPARYLMVEVLMGALFAATILRFGADWVVPAYLVLFTCLVAVSAVDLDYHIIPNRIVYPTIFAAVPLLGLAAVASGDGKGLREALAGGAYAWVALLVIHLISPRGMGFGDVRLAFILGLFLGWLTMAHVATGIFMGFVLGAVIGVSLIVVGLKGRRDAIPFGPFLAAGTALTIFVGGPIIRWWIG